MIEYEEWLQQNKFVKHEDSANPELGWWEKKFSTTLTMQMSYLGTGSWGCSIKQRAADGSIKLVVNAVPMASPSAAYARAQRSLRNKQKFKKVPMRYIDSILKLMKPASDDVARQVEDVLWRMDHIPEEY